MGEVMSKLILCVLSLAVFMSPVAYGAGETAQNNSAKLAEVQAAIDDLNKQLDSIKSQRSELQNDLNASETQISEAMRKVEDIKKQIKAEEAKQGALAKEKK
jgi:peptidoglycan hydrolase CwlO-like protein